MINLDRSIRLFERRCWSCGQWWAGEREHHGSCPHCAHLAESSVRARANKLERSNAALRGQLKKLRAK